ncbi:MAG: glycogen debranching enzyme N-terminal domain-containing protein [Candidatus Bathyarchaeota archaeon]|nr:glycogen debranching enzyme N-terminal domain-containing protein [Candidatus Bathyarchaeota archaeon]
MKPPTLKLTTKEVSDFNEAAQKEWLITNGLGGYASSTILGVNTRKYHGLLVAALSPPGDRTVCLSKLDEELNIDGKVYLLGTNEFKDAVFPRGYIHLEGFSVSPFPTYFFNAHNIEIQKTIFMHHEQNVTTIVYRVLNRNTSEATVKLFPLTTCRHHHAVIDKSKGKMEFSQSSISGREVQVTFTEPKVTIALKATGGAFVSKPNWIERLFYREEASRGESSIDDCYQPGYFQLTVPPNSQTEFAVSAAAEADSQKSIQNANAAGGVIKEVLDSLRWEQQRYAVYLDAFYNSHLKVPANEWLSWILLAADCFTVKGFDDGRSVVAGYHWFEAWGRDTFISLPGLLLVPHRFNDARKVLLGFSKLCMGGLIPNFLSDLSMTPACNTVDASLWYVNAVLQYLKYTGDFEFVRSHLWCSLKRIVESHVEGTLFGIHVDGDGLLAHGPQLTWMDAEADGKPVTPRAGKAVEIQALWYNTLRTMQALAMKFGEKTLAESYAVRAEKAKASFRIKFWNEQRNCLFDVLGKQGAEASIRPNQIIAVSLDFTMLDGARNVQILDLVEKELLTPCGLRTLERGNPNYKGTYQGDRIRRDQAYHNGTVWPWLLGPFTTAFLKAKGDTTENRIYAAKNFIEPLLTKQIAQAGLGTVNEVFDGDAPHSPRGCIAQAWSIAEPLRAYIEDILQVKPKHEKEIRFSL